MKSTMEPQQGSRHRSFWVTLALLLMVAGLTGGCLQAGRRSFASASVVEVLSAEADPAFARAYEPIPFRFPEDHGPHPSYQTEWWYYTGTLQDAQGGAYGYQITFFRTALTVDPPHQPSPMATNQIYMAHFALTDGPGQRHWSFERFSRGAAGLAGAGGEPAFGVWLEDWAVQEVTPGQLHVQARVDTDDSPVAIDLTLRETRAPILHGHAGLSQKGPEAGNASYYYSLVHLETTGSIARQGSSEQVTGVSWFDHEFGTRVLSPDARGWQWFSLEMDQGSVLMFAQIRTDTGAIQSYFDSTFVYADGRQVSVPPQGFALTPIQEWTSPATGFTYPSGWRATFPELDLILEIEPLIPDQEMRGTFVYWEGAVTVRGTLAGAPITGRGYVELTGYGAPSGRFQR